MTTTTTTPTDILTTLLAGHEVSDRRRESLQFAIEAGVDQATLETLRDTLRLARKDTIVLPRQRFELMSRGRGWCRMGRGDSAVWGEREDGGYRVGPGRWTVGGHDGFQRKGQDEWRVRHIAVGTQTWTVAD